MDSATFILVHPRTSNDALPWQSGRCQFNWPRPNNDLVRSTHGTFPSPSAPGVPEFWIRRHPALVRTGQVPAAHGRVGRFDETERATLHRAWLSAVTSADRVPIGGTEKLLNADELLSGARSAPFTLHRSRKAMAAYDPVVRANLLTTNLRAVAASTITDAVRLGAALWSEKGSSTEPSTPASRPRPNTPSRRSGGTWPMSLSNFGRGLMPISMRLNPLAVPST